MVLLVEVGHVFYISPPFQNNRIAIGAAGFDFFIGRVFTRSFDVPVTTAYQTASLPGLIRSTSNQLLFGECVQSLKMKIYILQ